MRRGSVTTWEPYARRSSANMAQFVSGNRTEFVPDIECNREGGWFVSYRNAIVIAILVFGCTIAVGVIVWHLSIAPEKKPRNSLDTIDDDAEEGTEAGMSFISSYVQPTRYHVELLPVITDDKVSMFKGRVYIQFSVSSNLNTLVLNAKNISAVSCILSMHEQGKRKRRQVILDEADATAARGTIIDQNPEEENSTGESVTDRSIDGSTSGLPIGHPDDNTLSGSSEEDGLLGQDTRVFETDDESDDEVRRYGKELGIREYRMDAEKELLTIYPSERIIAGDYTLEVTYNASVDPHVIHIASYDQSEKNNWLMVTRLKPIRARSLLPLFDDASLKARFSVSVTHPKGLVVLSNAAEIVSVAADANSITDDFSPTPPLSPDNLAIAMGTIESVMSKAIGERSRTRLTLWRETGVSYAGSYLTTIIESGIANLINLFAVPYPFPKLDLVGAPNAINAAYSAPGLISIEDSFFEVNESTSMPRRAKTVKTLIHLLGEQWLGGIVSMRNWSDVWVPEGTLIYLESALLDKIDPTFDSNGRFIADEQLITMDDDSYGISKALVTDISPLHLDLPVTKHLHQKGACMIAMLHGIINDSAFRNGYKRFINRWKKESADDSDFWIAMSEAAKHTHETLTLKQLMDPWIDQSGYPVITVDRNYESATAKIKQSRFTYGDTSASEQTWNILLTIVDEDDAWSMPRKMWLTEAEAELKNVSSPGERSWVLLNVNKTGFYRTNYDDDNWKLLIEALEKDHETFPPATRASLIDDVFSLATAGLIKYAVAFDLIKYLKIKDRHFAPWAALAHHISKLNFNLYDSHVYPDFQKFVLEFVSPIYEEVIQNIEIGDSMTETVVKMACMFENEACLEWTRRTYSDIKNNPSMLASTPTHSREIMYCTVAKVGGHEEWVYFLDRASNETDGEEKKRVLSSFPCFEAPWVLKAVLNEIVYETRFTDDEVRVILESFPKYPAAVRIAYSFIKGNWENIVKRYSKSYRILQSFIAAMANGLTSEQDIEDFNNFRESNSETMRTIRYMSALIEAKGKFLTTWTKDSVPKIHDLLKTYSVSVM